MFDAGFIGSPKMNLMKARIEAIDATGVKVTSADLGTMVLPRAGISVNVGDEVTVGLRPHHLGTEGAHRIAGTVRLVERLGNETLAVVVLGSGQQIIAALPGDVDVLPGAALSLGTAPDKASLFLASGVAA